MSNTKIVRSYSVGDRVWWAHCGTQEVRELCPVCFGKLEVTLTLGDGSVLTLPCDYCGKGFEGPKGYVKSWTYRAEAENVEITAVLVNETQEGEHREYRHGCYCLSPDDIFATKEEALAPAAFKAKEHNHDGDTQAEYIKANAKKSFSWNAGYHLREAKRNREQAEYHERKAVLCKERAKP